MEYKITRDYSEISHALKYDDRIKLIDQLKREKDYYQWKHHASGYDCYILRQGGSGHLCGYVEIPLDHPLFGIEDKCQLDEYLEAHGGITFSRIKELSQRIGFDCAHSGDLQPFSTYHEGDIYRDVTYVTEQCNSLATQLYELKDSATITIDRKKREVRVNYRSGLDHAWVSSINSKIDLCQSCADKMLEFMAQERAEMINKSLQEAMSKWDNRLKILGLKDKNED